jgi:hypothetical protein
MSKTAKFISGDGVEHEVSVESVAFELMSKDGAFERIDENAAEPAAETVEVIEKPLAKMNKLELLAEAERRGLELVPDEVTKAQIILAIEVADAKGPEPTGDAAGEGSNVETETEETDKSESNS